MKKKQFLRAQKNSQSSNAIKSTRRIFFNHLYKSIEERGHFHVDQTYGSGTGILIKFNRKFFLLTARHVIQAATDFNFQNESPFWITSRSQYNVTSMYDFLMPAKLFHVGEEISQKGTSIDSSDVVAIELFPPFPHHQPDHFLDFDSSKNPLLTKDQFFEGQLLYAAGYPFEKNYFKFFDEPKEDFTHETRIQRHIVDGMCVFEGSEPHISLEPLTDSEYSNLSGASGGIVTNIQPKANMVKAAGMILSGGKKIIRFLPSYLIMEALKKINHAKVTVIDPAAESPIDLDKIFLVMADYFKKYDNQSH